MKWYITTAKRDFATHGFVECPLSDEQLTQLYKMNVKLEDVYRIGCDVAAGFTIEQSLEAMA